MIVSSCGREFRPNPSVENLRGAFHQVKLTLMIEAIGLSDDKPALIVR
jgi:hypothetical protein